MLNRFCCMPILYYFTKHFKTWIFMVSRITDFFEAHFNIQNHPFCPGSSQNTFLIFFDISTQPSAISMRQGPSRRVGGARGGGGRGVVGISLLENKTFFLFFRFLGFLVFGSLAFGLSVSKFQSFTNVFNYSLEDTGTILPNFQFMFSG